MLLGGVIPEGLFEKPIMYRLVQGLHSLLGPAGGCLYKFRLEGSSRS